MNRFQYDAHDRRGSFIFGAVIAGFVGAMLVILAVKFTGLGAALVAPQVAMPPPSPAPSRSIVINNYEKSIIDVVNRVGPSVVMITTNSIVQSFDFFSGPQSYVFKGLGSGVIYRSDGYILTNNHVINSSTPVSSNKITVVLQNGKTYPAKVIGSDSRTDLAVLKINAVNLPVLEWGDSNQVQVGQMAIAIGNPLAENLKNTVTVGVISAKERALEVSNDLQLMDMIQTDASINPGNSGGPLLDSNGRLIGINTAIAEKSQGIGFSTPSNMARAVAEQLIEKGYVTRPGLGIIYYHYNKDTAELLEYQLQRALPTRTGLFVIRIVNNSPAALAGLQAGDIIVKVNGLVIGNEDLVKAVVARNKVGTRVVLEFYRRNRLRQVTLRIGELGRID
ncbi:MAG: trypsin-like peptidase domain-containing protein [Firmicutes bacterium]|nr:trypsin-like peptidase domain-containing protein [Bacillota bacterium]